MEFQRKPPKIWKTKDEKETMKRLVIVLERCFLETAKVGDHYALLNGDDHHKFLTKYGKDFADYRPDIPHQCLLTLLDSPLNRAGLLQIFMQTEEGVLIEIDPHTRAPRTFRQFSRMVVQLLHNFKIRAENANHTLLKVIKKPVTIHLPMHTNRFGTSKEGKKVELYNFVKELPDAEPTVFVFGGLARGHVKCDYTTEVISFSDHPLSASVALGKLLDAFEEKWQVDPPRR
ncbi:Ribosomal RNA small subunit methyltransferase NEP1 [Diplonema papillatum]|nr:Ribosomal RNA small subunit methyltransferase NEP1 [Diplonema papillatum]